VQNGEVAASEAYFTRDMKNHHGGMVLVDGYLYGYNDQILTCLEFATGKMMWRDRSAGKGSVTYADGHLYIQSENNVVGLAEATSAGYREKGRFEIPDKGRPSWAHPVISDGRLYVRNQDTLLVYDVKDEHGPVLPRNCSLDDRPLRLERRGAGSGLTGALQVDSSR
jgi:outer membrane protein assembly factor BamB